MSLPFYDGSLQVAQRHGPAIQTVDPVTFSQLTTYTFQQLEPFYIQQMGARGKVSGDRAMGDRDRASGGFLVEWSEPKHIGGGVLEFTRTYAQIPAQRTEYEAHLYSYQFLTDGSLTEVPMLTQSRVVYDYYHLPRPATIPVAIAPRYFMIGSALYVMGNERDLLLPEYLAEDQSLTRWKGFMWFRKSRYVKARTSFAAL